MNKRVIALTRPEFQNEDGVAAAAILPGTLVMGVGSISPNTANAADVSRTFALEREEMGDSVDVPYAIGDTVKIGSFSAGQRVLAWVPSGQTISAGGYLEANNAGQLVAHSAGARLARSLEAIGPTVSATRIRVEIV